MSAIKEKRMKMTSVGKDVEKLETLLIAYKNVKQCSHYGNQVGVCSEKVRDTIII